MSQKIITFSLPAELLEKLNAAAHFEFATRSDYIRQAIIDKITTTEAYKARLAQTITVADAPTEDELFEILRRRQAQRWYIDKNGDWRLRGSKEGVA